MMGLCEWRVARSTNGERGELYAMLYAISDGSDFLPHKGEVTDSETEKGDGHNRN